MPRPERADDAPPGSAAFWLGRTCPCPEGARRGADVRQGPGWLAASHRPGPIRLATFFTRPS